VPTDDAAIMFDILYPVEVAPVDPIEPLPALTDTSPFVPLVSSY
jgi:hypothetical protein